MREIRYRTIADELRRQLTAGDLGAGRLLPSEAELGDTFAASRVTIRRALELLRDEKLIDSRQGLGWFVAIAPVRQSTARLGTIESQLSDSGIRPERHILEFAFERADPSIERDLETDTVLRVKRLNLADGEPFAVVTVWCRGDLGRGLSRDDVERSPFYELLHIPLARAIQTIAADIVGSADATLLRVPTGSPILRCRRVTSDVSGRAVLVSEHVFPAHRTEFVVDLASTEPSIAPTGLRLVE